MFTVVVEVKAKGEGTDFEQNARVEYLHIKSKADVDAIQQALVQALFALGRK
jgi:hypothetical protein